MSDYSVLPIQVHVDERSDGLESIFEARCLSPIVCLLLSLIRGSIQASALLDGMYPYSAHDEFDDYMHE